MQRLDATSQRGEFSVGPLLASFARWLSLCGLLTRTGG